MFSVHAICLEGVLHGKQRPAPPLARQAPGPHESTLPERVFDWQRTFDAVFQAADGWFVRKEAHEVDKGYQAANLHSLQCKLAVESMVRGTVELTLKGQAVVGVCRVLICTLNVSMYCLQLSVHCIRDQRTVSFKPATSRWLYPICCSRACPAHLKPLLCNFVNSRDVCLQRRFVFYNFLG